MARFVAVEKFEYFQARQRTQHAEQAECETFDYHIHTEEFLQALGLVGAFEQHILPGIEAWNLAPEGLNQFAQHHEVLGFFEHLHGERSAPAGRANFVEQFAGHHPGVGLTVADH